MPTDDSPRVALDVDPAAVALPGGVLAAVWRPSNGARSLIQHFAAGLVLAALAVELPFLGLSLTSETTGGWRIIAFSAAALLSLVTEELLVEAHREEKEPPFATLVIFAGFLAFWCVSLFGQGI